VSQARHAARVKNIIHTRPLLQGPFDATFHQILDRVAHVSRNPIQECLLSQRCSRDTVANWGTIHRPINAPPPSNATLGTYPAMQAPWAGSAALHTPRPSHRMWRCGHSDDATSCSPCPPPQCRADRKLVHHRGHVDICGPPGDSMCGRRWAPRRLLITWPLSFRMLCRPWPTTPLTPRCRFCAAAIGSCSFLCLVWLLLYEFCSLELGGPLLLLGRVLSFGARAVFLSGCWPCHTLLDFHARQESAGFPTR